MRHYLLVEIIFFFVICILLTVPRAIEGAIKEVWELWG